MVVPGSAVLERSYRCWTVKMRDELSLMTADGPPRLPFLVADGPRHLLPEGQKLCRLLNAMTADEVEAFISDGGPLQYMKEAVRTSDRERKMHGGMRD